MTESQKQFDTGRRQTAAFAVVCAAVIAARVYLAAIRGSDLRAGWRLPETHALTASLIAAACLLSAVAARLGRMYFNPGAATLLAAAAGGLTTAGYNALLGTIPGGTIGLLVASRIARRVAVALMASLAAILFGVLSGIFALWLDPDLSDGPSVATVLAFAAALAAAIVIRGPPRLWRRRPACTAAPQSIEAVATAAPQPAMLRGRRWGHRLGKLALLGCVVTGFWLSLPVDLMRRVWKMTGYMPYRAGVEPSEVAIQPLSWSWLWPGPLAFDGDSVAFPYDATDDDLRAIGGWSSICSLTVPGDNITDAGLDHLAGLTSLYDLSLHSSKITDRGLSALDRVPLLAGLELERSSITVQGLSRFASAGQLNTLSLKGTRLTDDDLRVLRRFPRLWRLSLSGTDITDEGLHHLESLTRLSALDLSETKITKRGLQVVMSLPLQSTLPVTRTFGDVLPTPSGPRLHDLNLARTGLTDDDIEILTRFGSLCGLTLDGNPITDEAMSTLLQIPDLVSLSLADTQITDDAIADFESITSLRSLNLRGTRVTQEGVNRLRGLKWAIR